MNVGLYRLAASMSSQERSVETIARNLANVGTAGFKRSNSATAQFSTFLKGREVRGVRTVTNTDFSQGNIEQTGRALDIALMGEGFITADGPQGELYTRHGSLRVDVNGVLVTPEGFQVAWERGGSPVDPVGGPLTIDMNGSVRQDQRDLGTLRIANFEDPQRLLPDGQGYWVAPADLTETTHTAAVHQYSLESSNATGMGEMISLISAQRSFEQAAQVLNSVRESYQRLTRPT